MNIYIAAIVVITQIGNPNVLHSVNGYTNWNPYNIILLSNKNERTNDTRNNMDELQMSYAK